MATIGGLSSTTSASTSSIRGYGGLASGLDRDTLIEQLTSGTQSKIDSLNQQKTKLEWEQEAIREITDKIYDFTQKYTSYSSSTNLLGSALFGLSDVTVNGENSKYISVSGSAQSANLLTVLGVKQMAQKATLTTTQNASDRELSLGNISTNLNANVQVNTAGGSSIRLKYGNTSYTVTLGRGDGYSYNTPQDVADSINKSLKEVTMSDGKTLADVMEVSLDGDKLVINNKDSAGNTITITGGSNKIMETLGFTVPSGGIEIATNRSVTADNTNTAIQSKTIKEQLAGQSISFEYNGTIKWIEMPSEDEFNSINTLDQLQTYLQDELNSAFGNGRIRVDLTTDGSGNGSLSFKTTTPVTGADGRVTSGADDNSSTLSITSSTGYLTGEDSLFGVQNGVSNRLNLSATIAESGLKNSLDTTQPLSLVINGKTIDGITADSTIQDIIDAVNNDPEAGVTISYQENTDRFIITATQNGASGHVTVSGNVADALFGTKDAGGYTVSEGKDAIIAVQYAGSNKVTEIVRDSNTVSVDGLNITVNGTFGYDEKGDRIQNTEAVTFTAKADTDKIVETVTQMINEYNEILELINDQVSTKPDRDYTPLTSSQKAEMSENEIELWENKAKEGLIFMDSDLRSMADALRFIIPSEIRSQLEAIGITTSSDYSDNGKLTLDESELRAAIESNPESVRNLFSANATVNADGTTTSGGLIRNMKTILDRYASTTGATKGILVERAGSEHALTSVLNNSLQDEIDEIDDRIAAMTERLTTEQDRYISQFTQLELLISQMNSQSSYLASLSGGY
ncbi:MAG TPA: flagellar filament capping protein FliD [Candidatus Mediterraneibacter norfolkensis]|nr:flagellar filament capping protein FliD [Candidatus Mediterraneibacter norfolkensis]